MSLVSEFGAEYFSSRFSGSYFFAEDGTPCVIGRNITERTVEVSRLEGPRERLRRVVVNLPAGFFTSMNVLRGPRLGWRCSNKGKFLAMVSRNNQSYQRGYNHANINVEHSPHTSFLFTHGSLSDDYFSRAEVKAKLTMEPEYLSLAAGIEEMNSGQRAAFAINPDVAVVVDNETTYSLLGRSGKIGTVGMDGSINMVIPFNSQLLEQSA